MARDGTGGYNLPEAAFVYDTIIDEVAVNSNFSDLAAAMGASLAKDGQTNPTANLPMNNFRHTGVANASARTDYAAAGQVQDGALVWCGTAGGTANALTLSPTPSIPAYATGMELVFKAGSSASTSTVTISVSGLGTKAAEFDDAALSAASTIEAGKYYRAIYDGTAFQLTRVSSPSAGSVAKTASFSVAAGDIGAHFSCDAASGAITASLPAAATATGRFWAIVSNTGASNNVTIDPDGSETVNGEATLILPPKTAALLRCDGANWSAVKSYDVAFQFANAGAVTPVAADKILISDASDSGAVKTALASEIAGLGIKLKTGAYSGDGTTSNAVTGVGFAPKVLLIWESQADGGNPQWGWTSDTYMANDAQGLFVVVTNAGNTFSVDNRVLSFDSDGFTLSDDGANAFPNTSGTSCQYIAIG